MHVLEIQSTVPEALSSLEVQRADGSAHVLRDFWAGQPCLLVFLRHFGCIGCSENVRELAPRLPELKRLGVRTVFIGCGAPFFIPPFQERHNLLHAPVSFFDVTPIGRIGERTAANVLIPCVLTTRLLRDSQSLLWRYLQP